jgi:hypothetical protein
MVKTQYLGINKISNNFTEHQINCEHYKVLDDNNIRRVTKIIEKLIKHEMIGGILAQ